MKKTVILGINLFMGLSFISLASYIQPVQQTNIKVTGIRSSKGNIIVQVFKDNATYEDQKPFKKITFDKKALVNGMLSVTLDLEPAIYGFTMIDDENGNGDIDKNLIGMPKEGFGFSNFFLEKMKKPKFDDFKTNLTTQSNIVMKVKYM